MASANAKLRAAQASNHGTEAQIPNLAIAHRPAEEFLIRQAQAGRWESFAELAGRYDGPLLALALRLTGSEQEARELFLAAFSQAYQELRGYRFQCSFFLWIYRVVARVCIQFLHQQSGRKPKPRGNSMATAIEQLSPRERMVLELKHYFGLKLETIAAILETTEAATRNTFVRAVLILRMEGQSTS